MWSSIADFGTKVDISHRREFRLILPDGTFFKTDSSDEELESKPFSKKNESISKKLKKIVLNDFSVQTVEELDEAKTMYFFPRRREEDCQLKYAVNPHTIVRVILLEFIHEVKSVSKLLITREDALELRSYHRIHFLLERTQYLKNIDIGELKTIEETTSFLINLTNLMWIHALLFTAHESKNGLLLKNWALRNIHFNFIGYEIGQLGFVSLYDLHSTLFNYPEILRTNVLNSLKFRKDPRIHFAIAQPYAFSPRIHVAEPNNLDSYFDFAESEHLKYCIFLDADRNILISAVLLLQMERTAYEENLDGEINENVSDSIPDKYNLLIDALKKREDLWFHGNDIFIFNETCFAIEFYFSIYPVYEIKVQDYKTKKTYWKYCRYHKSLYHCLAHHICLVQNTELKKRISFTCHCVEGDAKGCVNLTLYKAGKLFYQLMRKFDYSNTAANHRGIGCLHSILSFTIGGANGVDITNVNEDREYYRIFKIIENTSANMISKNIPLKIKTCIKLRIIIPDMEIKWPTWYSLFFADPNHVLNDIVEHKYMTLAYEWIVHQSLFDPAYSFSGEAYGKFLSLLYEVYDIPLLKNAIRYIPLASSIVKIFDFFIRIQFDIEKLITLIHDVLYEISFNETEKLTFYLLLIGLELLMEIPPDKQVLFYDITWSPSLIVEQLILNKKIDTLKIVLNKMKMLNTILLPHPDIDQVLASLKDEIDELLKSYAEKSLHFRKETPPVHCKYAALLHAVLLKDGNFHPPDHVPPVGEWMPNDWALVCMCCSGKFTVFNRRHHCRRCGRIICGLCSTKRLKLSTSTEKVRVCDQCFSFESQYETSEDSASLASSTISVYHKIRNLDWILSRDTSVNDYVREQAAFDTAPDIELCLSILELHSENIAVPRFLFSKAEEMLKILRQRLICPANFDYPEVTRIIRSLLSSAKIYYAHFGEMQGSRRCEELISEVDILNRLAEIGLAPPNASKPIRNISELRKIRDILLEQQNWQLALEISTKIGSSDCAGIWYLWGKFLLKSGDWVTARDKFSRSNLKRNSNLLPDVLQILSSNSDKETPTRFAFFKSNTKKSILSDKVYEECLYYLETYGNIEQLFHFYVENNRILEAVKITYPNNISPKLFLQDIYIPHLENKENLKIHKFMESIDPTLLDWKHYINEICVYCSKNKYFEELYEIQLWIKDYFRAAISCTMFYKSHAKSYRELIKNQDYLQKASLYFSKVIEQTENNDLTKYVKPCIVSKYLNMVHLQVDIMNVICQNNVCANTKFRRVPTLFDRKSEKIDLIPMIFDAASDLKTAFDLTYRLKEEFSLDSIMIYGRAAQHFVHKNQENSITILIKCIMDKERDPQKIIDGVIVATIKAKPQKPDIFLNNIADITTKIDMFIEAEWLKSAYMLAVKHNRLDDVKKILKEAKRLNMSTIEKICAKKLGL